MLLFDSVIVIVVLVSGFRLCRLIVRLGVVVLCSLGVWVGKLVRKKLCVCVLVCLFVICVVSLVSDMLFCVCIFSGC